ncbi:hypothetical protein DRB06_12935, partial [Actinomyces sp. Z5]
MRTRKIHGLLAAVLTLTSALLITDSPHAGQADVAQSSPSAGVSASGDGGGSIEASVTVTYASPG